MDAPHADHNLYSLRMPANRVFGSAEVINTDRATKIIEKAEPFSKAIENSSNFHSSLIAIRLL
jgi:hypothetical protein